MAKAAVIFNGLVPAGPCVNSSGTRGDRVINLWMNVSGINFLTNCIKYHT